MQINIFVCKNVAYMFIGFNCFRFYLLFIWLIARVRQNYLDYS